MTDIKKEFAAESLEDWTQRMEAAIVALGQELEKTKQAVAILEWQLRGHLQAHARRLP